MFLKRLLSLSLLAAMCGSSFVVSAAVPNDDEKQAEKTRAEIRKLGTGPDALIEIELRDKTKVKGYVGEANDVDFVVIDPSTKTSTTVAYPQVRKAKGNNWSGGVKIALTVAVIAAVTFLTYKYGRRNRRYGY